MTTESSQRQIDLDNLKLRQSYRYRLLKTLYDLANGDSGRPELSIPQLARHANLQNKEAEQACRYLLHEKLISRSSPSGECSITHKGVIEIEETIEFPNKRSVYFASSVVQNYFHGSVGAVQNGEGSTSTVHNELKV